MARKKYEIKLSADERKRLRRISSVGKNTPQVIKNALILLNVDTGEARHTDEDIAEALDIDRGRIYRVKHDYLHGSLDLALRGELSRRGHRRRSLDAGQVRCLLGIYGEPPPSGSARWSASMLSFELDRRGVARGVSRATISRTLRENGVSLKKTYSK